MLRYKKTFKRHSLKKWFHSPIQTYEGSVKDENGEFITHGDFKLKNIQTFGRDDPIIKIIDFEFATYFEYLDEENKIDFEEKKKQDMDFAKRTIYQLIWNKKYGEIL